MVGDLEDYNAFMDTAVRLMGDCARHLKEENCLPHQLEVSREEYERMKRWSTYWDGRFHGAILQIVVDHPEVRRD